MSGDDPLSRLLSCSSAASPEFRAAIEETGRGGDR